MAQPVVDRRDDQRGTRASRRRARVREQLLDAAEKAFAVSGYRDVRMEDLADAVDVSVGSIYGHFGSKDGLYLALGERAAEQFGEYLELAYRPEFSPLEQAMACGDAYLRFHLEHPGLFRFLNAADSDVRQADVEQRQRVGARVAEILDKFRDQIASAISAGEADSDYDAESVALFLWGAWNGVVSLGLRGDQTALTEEQIAAALRTGRRIVNEGLTAPGHRGPDGRTRARLVDTAPDSRPEPARAHPEP